MKPSTGLFHKGRASSPSKNKKKPSTYKVLLISGHLSLAFQREKGEPFSPNPLSCSQGRVLGKARSERYPLVRLPTRKLTLAIPTIIHLSGPHSPTRANRNLNLNPVHVRNRWYLNNNPIPHPRHQPALPVLVRAMRKILPKCESRRLRLSSGISNYPIMYPGLIQKSQSRIRWL